MTALLGQATVLSQYFDPFVTSIGQNVMYSWCGWKYYGRGGDEYASCHLSPSFQSSYYPVRPLGTVCTFLECAVKSFATVALGNYFDPLAKAR